jgi:hypothetical protein
MSSLILLEFWIYISFLLSLCENDAIMVGMNQIFVFIFYLSWVKEREVIGVQFRTELIFISLHLQWSTCDIILQ